MKARITIIFFILSLVPFVSAQEFDDVYFSPSKDKAPVQPVQTIVPVSDQMSSAPNVRSVDEYNRRSETQVIAEINDNTASDFGAEYGQLEYASRINRFYGGDIYINNADVYVDRTTGNVYVDGYNSYNNIYWNGGWNNPWHNHLAFYDPWYTPSWYWTSPRWGWSIGWNSGWGWSAGWGWNYPHYGYGGYYGGYYGGWYRPVVYTAPRHDYTSNRRPISGRSSAVSSTPSRNTMRSRVGTTSTSSRASSSNATRVNSRVTTSPSSNRGGTYDSGSSRGSSGISTPSRSSGSSRGSSYESSSSSSRSSGSSRGSSYESSSSPSRSSSGGFSRGSSGSSRSSGGYSGGGSRSSGGSSSRGGSRR